MSAPDRAPVPYVPIERQLIDSSVWELPANVCKLWVTLLIIASEPGRRGTVDMTLRALAGRACLTPEETREALERLMEPDRQSRSSKAAGRRLALIDAARDWGWRLVNWEEHEEVRRRMLEAARQKRKRSGAKKAKETPEKESRSVTDRHAASRSVTDRHYEDEVEDEDEGDTPLKPPHGGAEVAGDGFEGFWSRYPRKAKKPNARKAWAKLEAPDRAAVLAAVEDLADVWRGATGPELALVPHPASWLNARAWEDGRVEWERVRRGAGPRTAPKPALVGAHPPEEPRLLREVTQESPAWVIGVAKAIGHPARVVVPEDLEGAFVLWQQGDVREDFEPDGWRERLEKAIWEAVELDRKTKFDAPSPTALRLFARR